MYKLNRDLYWNLKAKYLHNLHEMTPHAYFDYLSPIINDIMPKSLLEIGYGDGRLYPLYSGVDAVVGVDISARLLKFAKDHKNLTLMKCNAEDIGETFSENTFDLVLTCKTLAHIPPDNISIVVENMVSVCKRYICIIETSRLNPDGADWSGGNSFRHDYKKIFNNVGHMELITHNHLFNSESRTELFLFKKEEDLK